MATVTKGGVLPDTGVTKNEVYALVDSATVTAIVNADVASNAAIVDTKLATISTASKVNTSALVTTSQAAGDVLYASSATAWTRLAIGTNGQTLRLASGIPAWESGAQIQMVNVMNGALASGTTVLPSDDTIPQITEGDEYMTLAITPKSATNKLKIEVVLYGAISAAINGACALFQDATAGALAAVDFTPAAANYIHPAVFTHYMTTGTTSATTFRVRAGGASASTFTFNGVSTARKYGGVMASSITITEISV